VDKRVLITGASGFAGRHLVAHCMNEGATVIGLSRGGLDRLDWPSEPDAYLIRDLLDAEQAEEAVQLAAPERVFHLAAEASVARSWSDPVEVLQSNLFTTLNLLEAVRRHAPQARVLVAGSGEEYGKPEALPVTEEHPLRPQNPYALSKVSGDLAAGLYADAHGMHIVRTRAFNHAGPGQSDTYVVSSLARQIAEAEAGRESDQVEVAMGNPNARRDFTDVRDVARAYWLALEHAEPGVYNICSGRSTAIASILSMLSELTDLEVQSRTDSTRLRQHEVSEIQGSHEKLTKATGWRPETPLDQTLRDTLDWWRAKVTAEVPG
jgi:GDP-4-dehydro-6-deoxy-D-mannose reductase